MPAVNALTADELKKILNQIVRDIWKAKAMPKEIDEALASFFASEYWKGVEQGYNTTFEEVDYNTPDYELLRKLEKDVFQFSSAKTYQQLKAISQALLGEDGKLRTYTQFRTAAAEINNEFVNQWLQAEYNYAVSASQSASQWVIIQETKELLPLLRYSTVGDDRVRPEHEELDDVTRPVDDAFWDTYYPPNGWNCRCDVIQISRGTITDLSKITLPEIKPLFMYNPGKQGIVFPPGHPYYDGLPDDVKEQGDALYLKKRKGNGND